jgi:hypothetical protein
MLENKLRNLLSIAMRSTKTTNGLKRLSLRVATFVRTTFTLANLKTWRSGAAYKPKKTDACQRTINRPNEIDERTCHCSYARARRPSTRVGRSRPASHVIDTAHVSRAASPPIYYCAWVATSSICHPAQMDDECSVSYVL